MGARSSQERADLADDACEIVLEGADRGTPKEEPVPPEPISYAWSVPRAKVVQPEVLIAYEMNGRDGITDFRSAQLFLGIMEWRPSSG